MHISINQYHTACIIAVIVSLSFLSYIQQTKINTLLSRVSGLNETNLKQQNRIAQLELESKKLSSGDDPTNIQLNDSQHIQPVKASSTKEHNSQKTKLSKHTQQQHYSDTSSGVRSDQSVFSERMLSDQNYDPITQIKNKFANEIIDENWATQYETHLIELFYTEELLASATVHEVTCKTSICELQVYSDKNAIEMSTSLARTLSSQPWRNQEASFSFNNIKNEDILIFYIGRSKNSLFTEKF